MNAQDSGSTVETLDRHGRLTDEGSAELRRWAATADARLDRGARRWARGVAVVDLGGLPVLLLLTPWHWAAAVAGWVVAVAGVTLVALLSHQCACARCDRAWQRRVAGMCQTTSCEATGTAGPPARAG